MVCTAVFQICTNTRAITEQKTGEIAEQLEKLLISNEFKLREANQREKHL